jgi:hypothetical protein
MKPPYAQVWSEWKAWLRTLHDTGLIALFCDADFCRKYPQARRMIGHEMMRRFYSGLPMEVPA